MGRFILCRSLVWVLPLVLFAAGCGTKTRPVPPQTVAPVPIDDLRFSLNEKGATLVWSYPQKTITGDDLTRITNFELFRAVIPEEEHCPGCPLPFGPPIEIEGGLLPEDGGRTVQYVETLLRPRHRYFFKVRARTGWWSASRDSNLVSFVWDTPAQAPADLAIKTGDRVLSLTWKESKFLLDGTAITGPLVYQVFRSKQSPAGTAAEIDALFSPLGEPAPETKFVDDTVANGERYFYLVRSLRSYEGEFLAGFPSEIVSGTPKDMTPPVPPRNLVAVRTSVGVKLFWEEVREKDLAGYRIYRRDRSPSSRPVLLGVVTATSTTFVDREPPEGKAVAYFVTAFDTAEPANESLSSIEAWLYEDE